MASKEKQTDSSAFVDERPINPAMTHNSNRTLKDDKYVQSIPKRHKEQTPPCVGGVAEGRGVGAEEPLRRA